LTIQIIRNIEKENMKEELTPHPRIVRACGSVHVGESPLSAMRAVIDEIWGSFPGFQREKAHTRRWVIASIVLCHARNRLEYLQVMGGNYSKYKGKRIVNPYVFDTVTKETKRKR
jgi:hypothetical protein